MFNNKKYGRKSQGPMGNSFEDGIQSDGDGEATMKKNKPNDQTAKKSRALVRRSSSRVSVFN